MIHLPTPFDRLIEDIALAGEQLTAMAACEGAARNVSVFTASLACPLDAVEDVELPAATYEVMNLSMRSPSEGLAAGEREAAAFGLGV